jgi:hypothetical protein
MAYAKAINVGNVWLMQSSLCSQYEIAESVSAYVPAAVRRLKLENGSKAKAGWRPFSAAKSWQPAAIRKPYQKSAGSVQLRRSWPTAESWLNINK